MKLYKTLIQTVIILFSVSSIAATTELNCEIIADGIISVNNTQLKIVNFDLLNISKPTKIHSCKQITTANSYTFLSIEYAAASNTQTQKHSNIFFEKTLFLITNNVAKLVYNIEVENAIDIFSLITYNKEIFVITCKQETLDEYYAFLDKNKINEANDKLNSIVIEKFNPKTPIFNIHFNEDIIPNLLKESRNTLLTPGH